MEIKMTYIFYHLNFIFQEKKFTGKLPVNRCFNVHLPVNEKVGKFTISRLNSLLILKVN